MNNPRDARTKLLAETLHGDWAAGPVAEFARRGAASARRRRRVRHAISTGAVAVLLAIIGSFALRRPVLPRGAEVASNTTIAPAAPRGYEVISDEQLLAQLHDRPLLVVKKSDGTREIVLLTNE